MITIAQHQNGPPGIAHGGVACGRLAEADGSPAGRVRLHRPVPLGQALRVRPTSDGCELVDGDVIATFTRLARGLDVEPFAPIAAPSLAAAERSWPGVAEHPFPTCFACGPARRDGLGLRPGPVGPNHHACRWTPPGGHRLEPWMVWALLDCPTGAPALGAVGRGSLVVTGELAVDLRETLPEIDPGHPALQVHARLVGRVGRRIRTEGALLGPDGRPIAVASATWIEVPREAVAS